jgi:hypothetical protein
MPKSLVVDRTAKYQENPQELTGRRAERVSEAAVGEQR